MMILSVFSVWIIRVSKKRILEFAGCMLVCVVKEAPLKHPSQITIIFYSVNMCYTNLTSSVWAKSPPLPLILTITLTSTSSMDRVEMLTVTVELSRSMWSSGHRSKKRRK